MAHFAKVKDGVVINVISADQEFIDNLVDTVPGDWIQTSYNVKGGVYYDPETGEPAATQSDYINDDYPERQRKNYAYIGGLYDYERNAFYSPQVAPSWTLNEDSCVWVPPVDFPEDFNTVIYDWDEDAYQADTSDPKTAGWVVRPEV